MERSKNRILIISLEGQYDFPGNFVDELQNAAFVQQVYGADDALRALQQLSPPHCVLIPDGKLTQPEFGHVWYAVLSHVDRGGTAIAMGGFAHADPSDINRFFAKAGLGWVTAVDEKRNFPEVGMNPDSISSSSLGYMGRLLEGYGTLSPLQYLRGVSYEDAWYYHEEELPDGGGFVAAAALGKVGKGRLGYIGGHESDNKCCTIAKAMCGLL